MTTPREHADPAVRYFMDNTLTCWTRNKGSSDTEWYVLPNPRFNMSDLEYYVGHEPPPPDKRTITLTVNGKEWVLPEPLREEPEKGAKYWIVKNAVSSGAMSMHWDGHTGERLARTRAAIHATAADAQAWADFDKWCRGGGV